MTKQPKAIIHGRDHERGGADEVRILWESAVALFTVADEGASVATLAASFAVADEGATVASLVSGFEVAEEGVPV